MNRPHVPQFGVRDPAWTYAERPGAYGVILDRQDRVLCVQGLGKIGLPGGGMDPGESPEAALLRELLEETGYVGRAPRPLGRANQFLIAGDEGAFNKLGWFFLLEVPGTPAPGGEHDVLWIPRREAVAAISFEFQRWAVEQAPAIPFPGRS